MNRQTMTPTKKKIVEQNENKLPKVDNMLDVVHCVPVNVALGSLIVSYAISS